MRLRLLSGLLLTVSLLSLGCQGTATPFTRGPAPADDPMLSMDEQKVRARSNYAYPDSLGNMPAQSTWREYYYR